MVKGVVDAFGTVDILVGSAGIMINKPVEEYTEDEWDRTIDINLKGNFLLSQAVVPIMKKRNTGRSSSWHRLREPTPFRMPFLTAQARAASL